MKHLKLFENNIGKEYWLVEYIVRDQGVTSFTLYEDKESAENDIIMMVNHDREELHYAEGESYTENDIFTDVDKAMDWYESKFNNIILGYQKVHLSKPYELPEKI